MSLDPRERAESRRELEQATAEAVLLLLMYVDRHDDWGARERLARALDRWRACRGLDEGGS